MFGFRLSLAVSAVLLVASLQAGPARAAGISITFDAVMTELALHLVRGTNRATGESEQHLTYHTTGPIVHTSSGQPFGIGTTHAIRMESGTDRSGADIYWLSGLLWSPLPIYLNERAPGYYTVSTYYDWYDQLYLNFSTQDHGFVPARSMLYETDTYRRFSDARLVDARYDAGTTRVYAIRDLQVTGVAAASVTGVSVVPVPAPIALLTGALAGLGLLGARRNGRLRARL